MAKITIILLSFILFIATGMTSFASQETSSKTRQITGTVTAIDTKNNTITVRKKNREVTLIVEDKTGIIQCINKTSITHIKIGDRVTAKYKETVDKNKAKSVTIRDASVKSD